MKCIFAEPCVDTIDFCDSYKHECGWDASMWMWMGQVCKQTCKKCGTNNFVDQGRTWTSAILGGTGLLSHTLHL